MTFKLAPAAKSKVNESEQLFESFCFARNLRCERIPVAYSKSPDYMVRLCDNTELIVEVKQIEPNKEEQAILDTPMEEWDEGTAFYWGIPGDRIRKKITHAIQQLKALPDQGLPTLLVIYDAIKVWPEMVDEYAVKVAMYGIETALISPETAPEGGARILQRWHGTRRKLTPQHNTTLSGIGILSDDSSDCILNVYHNYFAVNPLPRKKLALPQIFQFELESEPLRSFPNWRRVSLALL